MCLAVPVATGADLLNTAQVSYRDPAGVLHTGASNTVTVVVDSASDPLGLPDPDLSDIDHKIYTTRDTIHLNYNGNATGFNWELEFSGPAFSAAAKIPSISASPANVFPVSTPASHLALSSLSLPLGRYTIRVQATHGAAASHWKTATITVASSDLSGARVFPNPWRAARGDGSITFDQMTAGSTVKIFTVSGRLVKTLSAPSGSVPWDLTNDSGDKVASGLYLYLITDSQGEKARGKLAIIR